jgi:hypothetical protein
MEPLFDFIRSNLINKKYQRIEELLSELPLEEWAKIWQCNKEVARRKIAEPDRLIMRDCARTAVYFNVENKDIERLTDYLHSKTPKPRKDDALDWRIYTFHKMIFLLDRYLLLVNPEYNAMSEDDKRRLCLLAIDDLLRKYETPESVQNSVLQNPLTKK